MIFNNRPIPLHLKLARGGIISSLILVCLLISSWLPTGKAFFVAVSSLFLAVVIMEIDILHALVVYITTSVLAFFLLPQRSICFAYILFFGLYGLVKFLAEQLDYRILQWLIKLVYFNSSLWILYRFASMFINQDIVIRVHWAIVVILAQVAFTVYDVMYSFFIAYYNDKLKKLWKYPNF